MSIKILQSKMFSKVSRKSGLEFLFQPFTLIQERCQSYLKITKQLFLKKKEITKPTSDKAKNFTLRSRQPSTTSLRSKQWISFTGRRIAPSLHAPRQLSACSLIRSMCWWEAEGKKKNTKTNPRKKSEHECKAQTLFGWVKHILNDCNYLEEYIR